MIFRQILKPKSVVIRYNDKPKPFMSWNNDMCLDVVIELEKKDGSTYDNTFTISGNFDKNNPDNKWGSAFKIERFFQVCGVNTKAINDDMTIPDSWLDQAIGKPFSYIRYPSTRTKDDGTNYWNEFDLVMHPDKGDAAHKAEFMKQVNKGWIKDYNGDQQSNGQVKPEVKVEPQVEVTDDIDF